MGYRDVTMGRVAGGVTFCCFSFCSCSKSGTVELDGFWRALRRSVDERPSENPL